METRIVLHRDAIDRLFRSVDGPVGKDLARRAIQVERTAKHLAPVDTGRLRSSVNHSLKIDGRGLVAFIGTNVDYAIYQEFGTRYQRGTPFLRPALRAAR